MCSQNFRRPGSPQASPASPPDPHLAHRGKRLLGNDALYESTPEREVLRLMANGRSNRGLAEALVITEDAVEKHVKHILRKLNIDATPSDHRRVLAVLTFLRRDP